jgi:peptide/nickel transport system ATP-binding protein
MNGKGNGMDHSKAVVCVQDVKKYYRQKFLDVRGGNKYRRQTVRAVDGVSFSLRRGEILAIIGESGCGKSTLARLLINLELPDEGDVIIDGESVRQKGKKDRLAFRRKVQLIFQNPYDTFDPRSTVGDILLTPLKLHGIGGGEAGRVSFCLNILEETGLSPAKDYLRRSPHELSGGQLQRISSLRSMMLNPAFVVADEPVSMLDISVRADIINMLRGMAKTKNACMVFISHDIVTTRYVADKVAVMYLGRIVEYGDADAVLHSPMHPYTRALISNSASIDPRAERRIISIEGEPPTPVRSAALGCFFEPRCYMRKEVCKQGYPPVKNRGGHACSCFFSTAEPDTRGPLPADGQA